MKAWITLIKPVGQTPLEALTLWKDAHPPYREVPASYAGRLDPMASGKLLILLGDECKRQAQYTGLDKEYIVEVLLDVGSDTGDALGIVEGIPKETRIDKRMLEHVLCLERGRHMRRYPQFSSKTVNGKPLFLHTLEGTIGTIDIPEHEERIYRIQLLKTTTLSATTLRTNLDTFLSKVPISNEPSKVLGADFRIQKVRSSWDTTLSNTGERTFSVLKIHVVCGSGAYMRSLAPRIGEALGTKALALSIHRTKIGRYWNGFWFKTY